MSDINRLIEIMAEMLIKHDEMVNQQIETNKRLDKMQEETSKRLDRMQEEISKLNLLSAENNRAIVKLANIMELQANLEPRVKKLEAAVFK